MPKNKTAWSPGYTSPFLPAWTCKSRTFIAGELQWWWWWWIIPHFRAFSEERLGDRWGSHRPLTSSILSGISRIALQPCLDATGLLLQLNPSDISMGSIPAQALLSHKKKRLIIRLSPGSGAGCSWGLLCTVFLLFWGGFCHYSPPMRPERQIRSGSAERYS